MSNAKQKFPWLLVALCILFSAAVYRVVSAKGTESLSAPEICIAGVQYDVSIDSLTGKHYLTVQTTEDFDLVLCEGRD